jgi:hypothetical protein
MSSLPSLATDSGSDVGHLRVEKREEKREERREKRGEKKKTRPKRAEASKDSEEKRPLLSFYRRKENRRDHFDSRLIHLPSIYRL